MMKAIFRLTMVALLCLVFTGPASAAIRNSKHDFSTTSAANSLTYSYDNETRMCIFCHTPHNAQENIPLWNRTSNAVSYDLYTSSATLTSATKASVIDKDNISYKCLSCHDGLMSIGGDVVRGTIGGTFVADDTLGTTATDYLAVGRGPAELTDDHPIGFDYERVLSGTNSDDKFNSLDSVTDSTLKFYNAGTKTNQMECATCHDVHDQVVGATFFLRTSNAGSALCLTCHQK